MSSGNAQRHALYLVPGGVALAAGLWTGLVRIGWSLPPAPLPIGAHGALMIGGFLGTLIGLERAVALRLHLPRGWPYLAPALCGLGAVAIVIGGTWAPAAALVTAGALVHVAVGAVIVRRAPGAAHLTMGLGAAAFLIGAALWLAGTPWPRVSAWWIGFLVLTIAGERLELARLVTRGPAAARTFRLLVTTLLIGLVAAHAWPAGGLRIAGASLAGLGLWLLRHDLATRTIRTSGLTRFMAACLLSGYVWLVFCGALWVAGPDRFVAGPWYDAMLHAALLGFVFSMIFGHAPVILPAVTGAALAYAPRFYAHLALLHASLVLRVIGDLGGHVSLRQWGGLLNVAAVVLFLASSATAALGARRGRRVTPVAGRG